MEQASLTERNQFFKDEDESDSSVKVFALLFTNFTRHLFLVNNKGGEEGLPRQA